jgi:hypothetical protein
MPLVFLMCSVVLASVANAQPPTLPVRVGLFPQQVRTFYTTANGLPSDDVQSIGWDDSGRVTVRTSAGNASLVDGQWQTVDRSPASDTTAKSTAVSQTGQTATGTADQLLVDDQPVFPSDGRRRWATTNVKVAFDGLNRLWFSSDQGAGCLENGEWSLFTGADGLPYDKLTCVATGKDGTVWFGTKIGAIRYDGKSWAYRQGKRWLPNDEVRAIAVDANGGAWIATAGGVARLYDRPLTLAEKAAFYESEIDKYNRRTEFGYVIEAHAEKPGDKTTLSRHESDNDGLWTSMYGAGECFAYGATKDAEARRRADDAFRALQFLSLAPQGSPHAPPSGFIARTVLETALGRDPNLGGYSLAGQRRMQQRDKAWRVFEPRWPLSADGKYYWKSDTSSDELDGHYFFYAAYYDLVAETEAAKAAVRDVVRANIDHLIAHDFSLHDHAGRTRWAVYGPTELNHNPFWYQERGLNSLSMLSYLNTAHHITGDQKYREVAKELRDKHSYHINALWPKFQKGIGSGNQSDDEMAFMGYYNLIKYEPDPELRKLYLVSFANSWQLEEAELNAFFNFCYAALASGVKIETNWGTTDLSPWPSWLADSIDTLQRFPLDRFDWSHTNQHRTDLVMLSDHFTTDYGDRNRGRGYRNNGKVLPVDERHFNHWNTDPWRLDTGGSGQGLADGAVFTLPYYMGLYHGFIAAD